MGMVVEAIAHLEQARYVVRALQSPRGRFHGVHPARTPEKHACGERRWQRGDPASPPGADFGASGVFFGTLLGVLVRDDAVEPSADAKRAREARQATD